MAFLALILFCFTTICITNVICRSESPNFPYDGCSTEEIDVLCLLSSKDSEMGQDICRAFFNHLLSFKSNKTDRVFHAEVYDLFSIDNPNVNVSSWNFHKSPEVTFYGDNVKEDIMRNYNSINETVELKVKFVQRLFSEMGGVRENVTRLAVIVIDGRYLSFDERRTVPHILQQQDMDIKIFLVVNEVKVDNEIVFLRDTILIERYAAVPKQNVLALAMCNQCLAGWRRFEHSVGAESMSCYWLARVKTFGGASSKQSYSFCLNTKDSNLVTIESQNELIFLQTMLHSHFNGRIGNSSNYTAQFFIGLSRDDKSIARRFRWVLSDDDIYRPLVVNKWLPGKPSGGYINECAIWQFDWSQDINSISNLSGNDVRFIDGWLDVNCSSKYQFILCENSFIRRVEKSKRISIKSATNERVDQTLLSGGFVMFKDSIVSVSFNFASKYFRTFLENIEYDLFPLFDCEENTGNTRRISYNLVCDGVENCNNSRDEHLCASGIREQWQVDSNECLGIHCCDNSCLFERWVNDGEIDCPVCGCGIGLNYSDESLILKGNETCALYCNDNICVHYSQLNDGKVDCSGWEGPLDETIGQLETANTCHNQHRQSIWAPKCVYVRDRYGAVIGCRDMSHLENCTDFQCRDGYVKCPSTYCVPQHYVLDKREDCPAGEDEQIDDIGPCTRNFACSDSKVCLHADLVCNGHPDCPYKDDEVDCNLACVEGFRCVSGTVTLSSYNKSIPLAKFPSFDQKVKYIDISGVDLSTTDYHNVNLPLELTVLKLSNCNIRFMDINFFAKIYHLLDIDISYNRIQTFDGRNQLFSDSKSVRYLNLSYNKDLVYVNYLNFPYLEKLDISHTRLSHLSQKFFHKILLLKHLDLSFTFIAGFYTNLFHSSLDLQTLDLRGLPVYSFHEDFFNGVTVSQHLYTDSFQLCCPQIRGNNIPYYTCHGPVNAISSCFDLVGVNIQRVLLWAVAILAVVGNTVVIGYRVIWDRSSLRSGFGLFVTNLSISDFIMGVYLFIITGADCYYRGTYVLNDKFWKESTVCRLAGFLATLSCEASMFFILLISLDRFLIMKFPFGQVKFSKCGQMIALLLAWFVAFLIALTPAVFRFETHSSSAMCTGLPLTTKRPRGWEFSFGVFIVLNFTLCFLLVYGQKAIFRTMSENRINQKSSSMSARVAKDILVAKQLSLVALFSFLCWFPIGIMGFLSVSGQEINNEVYAWTTVIVLPLNSAANPFLYTIPVLIDKWDSFRCVRRPLDLVICLYDKQYYYFLRYVRVISETESSDFPFDGCSTDDIDLLCLHYNNVNTNMLGHYMCSHFVNHLASFPHNKTSSRIFYAEVYDWFPSNNANINVSSWQLQPFDEPTSYGINNEETMLQDYDTDSINKTIELKVKFVHRLFTEIGGVRENVTHVAILFIDGQEMTYEERKTVPKILQQQVTNIKIFVVVMNINENQIVYLRDTILIGYDTFVPYKHILAMTLCNHCLEGWWRYNGDAYSISCYKIITSAHESSNREGNSLCSEDHIADIVAIESKRELFFLQNKIRSHFSEIRDGRKLSNISDDILIGLCRDMSTIGRRFRWTLNDNLATRPLVVNNWLPGKPSGGYSNKCAVWRFDWVKNSTDVTDGAKYGGFFVDGWTDVECSRQTSYTLCEAALNHRIEDNDLFVIKPAKTESFNQALKSGGFVCFKGNIVSVSYNFENKDVNSLLHQTNYKLFPLFDCGEDARNNRYISYTKVCNEIRECSNNQDENFCTWRQYEEWEYNSNKCVGVYCCDGSCLLPQWINDGEIDCSVCYCGTGNELHDESENYYTGVGSNETCAFICNDNECINASRLNDGRIDCSGWEGPLDETIGKLETADTCHNQHRQSIWAPKCVYVRDRYGAVIGCRDMSHLENCTDFQCPVGYVKCPSTYCIPQHYVLDKRQDCPTGEDEQTENIAPCTGNFACWNSKVCLHPDLVCNGHPDCPHKDDEVDCSVNCAEGFSCLSGTVTVSSYNKSIQLLKFPSFNRETKHLDMSGVDLSAAETGDFKMPRKLVSVRMSKCKIGPSTSIFRLFLAELLDVDVSYNVFQRFDGRDYVFSRSFQIRLLNLSYNTELVSVNYLLYQLLEVLDLSHTSLSHLDHFFLKEFPILKYLDLSFTFIGSFHKNVFPSSMSLQTLDLRGLPVDRFNEDFFNGLTIGQNLYADSFELCCPQIRGNNIPYYTCHAPVDAISSCFDLIGLNVQRLLLWVVAFLAVLGNLLAIAYHVIMNRHLLRTDNALIMINLELSDLVMSVYVIIIIGNDYFYHGHYVMYNKSWKESSLCKTAGFLATLSSETSLFLMFLTTCDRILMLRFPVFRGKLSNCIIIAFLLSWICSVLIALTPIILGFDTYNMNALCFALPLAATDFKGWTFSFAIFIVLNSSLCFAIAFGQRAISRAISQNITSTDSSISRKTEEEKIITKQMCLLSLSNFLSWVPVGFMGILSLGGHAVTNDIYSWTTVIAIPIKSALNPILYTIPVLMDKWEKFKSGRIKSNNGSLQ